MIRSRFLTNAGQAQTQAGRSVTGRSHRALSNISGSYRGPSVADHFHRSHSRIGGNVPTSIPEFRKHLYSKTNLNEDPKNVILTPKDVKNVRVP